MVQLMRRRRTDGIEPPPTSSQVAASKTRLIDAIPIPPGDPLETLLLTSGAGARAMERAGKRRTIQRRHRHAQEVEYGRHDVGQADDVSDAAGRNARRLHDERHAQHTLVEEDAMVALPMLAA